MLLAPLWMDPVTLAELRGNTPAPPPTATGFSPLPIDRRPDPSIERPGRPVVVASDDFSRSAGSGWGAAEIGGSYTVAADGPAMSVADGAGIIELRGASAAEATLGAITAQHVEFSFSARIDRLPPAGSLVIGANLRSSPGGESYRPAVRVSPTGELALSISIADGATDRALGFPMAVPDVAAVAGAALHIRAEALGIDPTTIRVRAWPDGSDEPGYWHASVIDWSGQLQRPGAVGVRLEWTQPPDDGPAVVVGIDDLLAIGTEEMDE